jgi:hypothetical protein
LRRRAGHDRWQSLVGREHGASINWPGGQEGRRTGMLKAQPAIAVLVYSLRAHTGCL